MRNLVNKEADPISLIIFFLMMNRLSERNIISISSTFYICLKNVKWPFARSIIFLIERSKNKSHFY